MRAQIFHLEPLDHAGWEAFVQYQSPDPYDDYGWFNLTIGAADEDGANNFLACVATPRAVGRVKRAGFLPCILVDHFDAQTVARALHARVNSVHGHTWEELVDRLRQCMRWEYEGMARPL
jgi:hypothetical protein